jgi:hypothetical protein
MRTRLAILLAAALGCHPAPYLRVARQDPDFKLTQLPTATLAVWPIPGALLDQTGRPGSLFVRGYLSTAQAAVKVYGSEDAYLDEVSAQFSSRLLAAAPKGSLASSAVVAALTSSDSTRPFLDPARTLGDANPENRFVTKGDHGLDAMAALPMLADVRYAVLFRRMLTSRKITTSAPPAPDKQTGASSLAVGFSETIETLGSIGIVVVDLRSRQVVWDGNVNATTTYIDEKGLLDLTENLVDGFVDQALPEAAVARKKAKAQREQEEREREESVYR